MKYCPRCGGLLQLQTVAGDARERLICQSCGFIFYQDPKVSACTVVRRQGRIILVRRAIEPGRGLWGLPGGYVDQGETVEEAALRETKEETGLQVSLIGLVGVYSYRTPVVVIVYACEAGPEAGEPVHDAESLELQGFLPTEIPWDHLAFPSTRDGLRDYLQHSKWQ